MNYPNKKIQYLLSLLFPIFFVTFSHAQAPMPAMSSGELLHELNKMQVVGSVLYVAAHPDDENTRLIAWLAGEKGYRVTYLSLTRGDGGQNLIGDEKGEMLGLLRTQELLGARRIDGGEQMFSRAVDFGYSKTPEETLSIWEEEKVLADVVWAIRKVRPDVIITRFAGPERGGGGHGHHTTSAILAKRAFAIAADPSVYPEQLNYVEPWQPKRIFWNTYTWRRTTINEEDKPHVIEINVDSYNPLLGKGYAEIASEARSMHRCQAFGASRQRGETIEKLLVTGGEPAEKDIFEGVNTNWSRLEGGDKIGGYLSQAKEAFQFEAPQTALPYLLSAFKEMESKKGEWYSYKRKKLKELIVRCSGLYFELNSKAAFGTSKDQAELIASVIKRSKFPVSLKEIVFNNGETLPVGQTLENNRELFKFNYKLALKGLEVSQPYWLKEQAAKGIYQVGDQSLIGLPENPAPIKGDFVFQFGEREEHEIRITAPVVYKYVNPAIGELYKPFVVRPAISVNLSEKAFLFASQEQQALELSVRAHTEKGSAKVQVRVPEGWLASPEEFTFDFDQVGEEKRMELKLTPPAKQAIGSLKILIDGKPAKSLQTIAYDHIPDQTVFAPSTAELVKIDVKKVGEKIAYLMGSGDEIPRAMQQIGFQVDLLEDDQIKLENLREYDAVISGIRAYNTIERMTYHHKVFMEYVKEGGTYICQYNTSRGLKSKELGPYPMKISRGRVTDENSGVHFTDPEHPVLNFPNKITQNDFEGWVQERGLYFISDYDEKYTPILEMNDPGEAVQKGSLLVTEYGEGHFVYCSLSMFRELPAGVPGAYRLFANIVSIGKDATQ